MNNPKSLNPKRPSSLYSMALLRLSKFKCIWTVCICFMLYLDCFVCVHNRHILFSIYIITEFVNNKIAQNTERETYQMIKYMLLANASACLNCILINLYTKEKKRMNYIFSPCIYHPCKQKKHQNKYIKGPILTI